MKCDSPSCKCSETKVERNGKKYCSESCAGASGQQGTAGGCGCDCPGCGAGRATA